MKHAENACMSFPNDRPFDDFGGYAMRNERVGSQNTRSGRIRERSARIKIKNNFCIHEAAISIYTNPALYLNDDSQLPDCIHIKQYYCRYQVPSTRYPSLVTLQPQSLWPEVGRNFMSAKAQKRLVEVERVMRCMHGEAWVFKWKTFVVAMKNMGCGFPSLVPRLLKQD